MVISGDISAEDAQINPDRDALTSYVGAGGLVEVDGEEDGTAIVPGDFLVLCTDGLFRALAPGDIAAVLESADDSQTACDVLIAQTLARGLPHQDNVTVLCIKVGQV
jgi:PPM family protein phosphatase